MLLISADKPGSDWGLAEPMLLGHTCSIAATTKLSAAALVCTCLGHYLDLPMCRVLGSLWGSLGSDVLAMPLVLLYAQPASLSEALLKLLHSLESSSCRLS